MGRIVGSAVQRHLAPSWGQLHSGQDQERRDERGSAGDGITHFDTLAHNHITALCPKIKQTCSNCSKHFTGSEHQKIFNYVDCGLAIEWANHTYVVLLNKIHLIIRILNELLICF